MGCGARALSDPAGGRPDSKVRYSPRPTGIPSPFFDTLGDWEQPLRDVQALRESDPSKAGLLSETHSMIQSFKRNPDADFLTPTELEALRRGETEDRNGAQGVQPTLVGVMSKREGAPVQRFFSPARSTAVIVVRPATRSAGPLR